MFTVEEILSITNGLAQLDTYEKTIKDGDNERTVRQLYSFGGALRWTIACNLDKGRKVTKQYQDTHNQLVTEHQVDGAVPAGKMAEFAKEAQALLGADSGVELDRIQYEDLKLTENPIPGSVLSVILPIVDK